MFQKRNLLSVASVILALGLASASQAATYSLQNGSGAQLHIGGGLALPVQTPATVMGAAFPPLLIPVKAGIQTVMGTDMLGINRKITVPIGVLSRPAVQKTVGVFTSNPNLYAVATQLKYTWPTAPAVFSVAGRPGAATTVLAGTAAGNTIRYSPRVIGKRFGGAGRFAISPGAPDVGINASPVTIYAIAVKGPGNPPCTFPAFVGLGIPPFPGPGNAACVAAIIQAKPTGMAAIGGPVGAVFASAVPGLAPGIGGGVFGPGVQNPTGPPGTVSAFAFGTMPGPGNTAMSQGFPWTTGMLTVSASLAAGGGEVFILSGADNRTQLGGGTIQMVSGALSTRAASGPNANRGWLRLKLSNTSEVPAMSDSLRLATIGILMLIGAGFVMRRRFAATTSA